MRRRILAVIAAVSIASTTAVLAKAPTSKEGMQPVDTSAGSLTDPRHLFQIDLAREISVDVSAQPLEVAFNQVSAVLGIEWGYAQGIDKNTPVSVYASGDVRKVLRVLGKAANVRFEAGGPTQLRVVKARSAAIRKPTPRPPAKRP